MKFLRKIRNKGDMCFLCMEKGHYAKELSQEKETTIYDTNGFSS